MKFKRQVKALLAAEDYEGLLELAGPHGGKTANILISLAGDLDEITRWRAIKGLGLVTARLYEEDPEKARRVLRQLIWNLNDESGGIGWGMPEAFGEILARQAELAREYRCILAGYLIHPENCLDNEVLLQGLVWALGRVKEFAPAEGAAIKEAWFILVKQAPIGLRAMAVWTLGELGAWEALSLLADLPAGEGMITFMTEDGMQTLSFEELLNRTNNKIKCLVT